MNKVKQLIKNNFTSFAYFYRYLRNKIFLAFALSIGVSFMDGMGLTMFFPLLKVVSGEDMAVSADMGNLAYIVGGIESLGIPMTLITVLIFMVLFFTLKGLAKYAQEVYLVILRQQFIRDIRLTSLRMLNAMSFKKFITSNVGRIQNTMTGEVERVSQAFNNYMKAFQQGVMVAIYMGFAFFLDAQFAVLVCIGGSLTVILYKKLYAQTKGASRKLTSHNSTYQGEIIQHVGHFKYLKASGRATEHGDKLEATIHKVESSRRRIGMLNAIAEAAREPMLVAVVAAVIFIQIKFLGGAIGAIIISLLFFYRALTALTQMQNFWNRFLEFSGSVENMEDFQHLLGKSRGTNGTQSITQFTSEIALKNINFAYGNTQVLHNINLTIKKNQSIALVGESGSGKTTLVSVITGLLTSNNGTLTIDGYNLANLKRETYQQRIGYVSQDPVIFNDTIFNNVTFWAEPTAENIKRFNKAVEQASLAKFLHQLPTKENTQLGNNGINLSGGQKQRISIARELYKDIDILILDEATSALDSETERVIQESIDALQGHYTLIMIAHRLATVRNADAIILMDKGQVVDVAAFEELQERQLQFKKMVKLQEI